MGAKINMKYFALCLLSIFLQINVPSAFAFSTHTEAWVEEAILHDGRIIEVNREVSWTFSFISGDEASISLFSSYPDKFWIKFINPDTRETIKWQGEKDYTPVLLDIVNGVPYLVVYGPRDIESMAKYQCPEVPLIVFKYEKGFFGQWKQIPPNQLPKNLKNENLSPGVPDDIDQYVRSIGLENELKQYNHSDIQKPKRFLTQYDVLKNIKESEQMSSGLFKAVIITDCPRISYIIYSRNGDSMSIDWFTNQHSHEACLIVCKQHNIDAQHCPCNSLFNGQ